MTIDPGHEATCLHHSDLLFSDLTFSIQRGARVALVADIIQHSVHFMKAIRQELQKVRGELTTVGDILMQDQKLWFLHDTIQQNIIFGTEFQPEKYEKILKLVGLEHLILGMPDIQNVVVSNNGYDLPADLQKLIVFARILYIDADVYLVDRFFDLLPLHYRLTRLQAILAAFPQKTFLVSTQEIDVFHCMNRAMLLRGLKLEREDPLPVDQATMAGSYLPFFSESEEKSATDTLSKQTQKGTPPSQLRRATIIKTLRTTSEREILTSNDYLERLRTMKADYSLKSMFFHLVPDEKYRGRSFMVVRFFLLNSGWKLPVLLLSMILVNSLATYTFSWYVSSWRANNLSNLSLFSRVKIFLLISGGALLTLAITAVTLVIQVRRSNHKLFTFMIKGLFSHGIEFFHKLSSAKIVNSIITEFMSLDDTMGTNLFGLFVHFIRLHVVFVISVYGTWFTALPIAGVYCLIIYTLLNTGYGMKSLASVVQANQLALTQTIQDAYKMIPFIRDCRCIDYNMQKFMLVNQIYQNSKAHQNNLGERWLQARLHGYIMFLPVLILLNGLFLRLFGFQPDKWQGIKLTIALDLVFSIQGLVSASLARAIMVVSLEKIRELVVIDEPTFKRKVQITLPLPVQVIQDSPLLEIRSLTICNPITSLHILNRISLKVKRSSRLALFGSRGSGKSTVFAVLLRLIDPTQVLTGKIYFEALDLNSMTDKAVNRAIFRLTGKFKLYDGSLKRNIDPHDELTSEAIEKVLEYLGFWLQYKANKAEGSIWSKSSISHGKELAALFRSHSKRRPYLSHESPSNASKLDSQHLAIAKPGKNDYFNKLKRLASSSRNVNMDFSLKAKSYSNDPLEDISQEVGRFINLMPKSSNKMYSLFNKENPELLKDVVQRQVENPPADPFLIESPGGRDRDMFDHQQQFTNYDLLEYCDLRVDGCSVDEQIGQKFNQEFDDAHDRDTEVHEGRSRLDSQSVRKRQPKKTLR